MKRYSHMNLLTKWIIKNLCILLIPVITASIVAAEYGKTLNSQAMQFNQYAAEKTSDKIKSSLVEIKKLYSDIYLENDVQLLASIPDVNDYYTNRKVLHIIDYLKSYSYYKNNISFFYMYIEKTDCVLSETGIVDSKFFYETYLSESDKANKLSYKKWKKDMIQKNNNEKFYPLTFTVSQSSYDGVGYNMSYAKVPGITVSFVLEKRLLFNGIEQTKLASLSDLFLFDNNGKLVLYDVRSDNPIPQDLTQLPEEDDSRLIISNLISFDMSSMTFVMVAPKRAVLSNVFLMRLFAIIAIILCLIIAFILLWYSLLSNYKPIKEILEILKISGSHNEFNSIKTSVTNILNETQLLAKINEEKDDVIRDCLLINILKNLSNQEISLNLLSKYGISFKEGEFLVTVFQMLPFNTIGGELSEIDYDNMSDDVRFILKNNFEELFSTETSQINILRNDNLLVCIFNFFSIENIELEHINRNIVYVINTIKSQYEFDISFASSKLHHSLKELPIAYREALQVLRYKKEKDITNSLSYDEIKKQSKNSYLLSLEKEQNLLYYIRTSDYENASSLITEIVDELQRNHISARYEQCVMLDIASTLIKISDALTYDEILNVFELYDLSYDSENLNHIKEYLLNATKKLCENAKKNNKNNFFKETVLEFIENNYEDVNFSVTSIANHYKLTNAYVSKLFKDNFNEVLTDYINRYRIKKAKELMRKKYTFNEISLMVGYNSLRTFNRLFKKYEGVTPGTYRSQNL